MITNFTTSTKIITSKSGNIYKKNMKKQKS
jgi:hypothetical protein